MKTPDITIASLLAAVIWADEDYSEVERETVGEIADALGIPEKDLNMNITAALVELKNLNEEKATEFAVKHAQKVDDEEIGEVYLAVMQLALCDGVLTAGEVNNIITIGEALDIDRNDAVLMLCDLVKTEPELEISFTNDEDE